MRRLAAGALVTDSKTIDEYIMYRSTREFPTVAGCHVSSTVSFVSCELDIAPSGIRGYVSAYSTTVREYRPLDFAKTVMNHWVEDAGTSIKVGCASSDPSVTDM
jgi:hypothetical protein